MVTHPEVDAVGGHISDKAIGQLVLMERLVVRGRL